jgi:hypothetical protein
VTSPLGDEARKTGAMSISRSGAKGERSKVLALIGYILSALFPIRLLLCATLLNLVQYFLRRLDIHALRRDESLYPFLNGRHSV